MVFLKTCISMTVTDSGLVDADLGILTRILLISNFHLSHFCLTNGSTVLSQGAFKATNLMVSNFLVNEVGKLNK